MSWYIRLGSLPWIHRPVAFVGELDVGGGGYAEQLSWLDHVVVLVQYHMVQVILLPTVLPLIKHVDQLFACEQC